jgi:hypothetical protein
MTKKHNINMKILEQKHLKWLNQGIRPRRYNVIEMDIDSYNYNTVEQVQHLIWRWNVLNALLHRLQGV